MARPAGLNPPDRRFQQRAARRCRPRRSTDDEATPAVRLQPADRRSADRAGQPADVHQGSPGRPRRGGAELLVALGLGPPHDRRPLPAGVLERADVGGGALPRPDARDLRDGATRTATRRSWRRWSASLQYLSHGRFIFGYGAGWQEEEYLAYGYEYPSARVRIAQLDEAIRVIKALWTESPATYHGPYYQVQDAYCEPRPDPLPPIMLAGDGERYMLRVVAEHADWWLSYARRPDVQRAQAGRPGRALQDVRARPGDDPQGRAADRLPGPRPGGGARPGRREARGRESGLRRRPVRASRPPGRAARAGLRARPAVVRQLPRDRRPQAVRRRGAAALLVTQPRAVCRVPGNRPCRPERRLPRSCHEPRCHPEQRACERREGSPGLLLRPVDPSLGSG